MDVQSISSTSSTTSRTSAGGARREIYHCVSCKPPYFEARWSPWSSGRTDPSTSRERIDARKEERREKRREEGRRSSERRGEEGDRPAEERTQEVERSQARTESGIHEAHAA